LTGRQKKQPRNYLLLQDFKLNSELQDPQVLLSRSCSMMKPPPPLQVLLPKKMMASHKRFGVTAETAEAAVEAATVAIVVIAEAAIGDMVSGVVTVVISVAVKGVVVVVRLFLLHS
jgi:hypothetical protein